MYHSLGCGHCPHCLSGEPVFCADEGAFGRTRDGCHADFRLAPARHCLPLPEELSFDVGAMLACTACTAFAASADSEPVCTRTPLKSSPSKWRAVTWRIIDKPA